MKPENNQEVDIVVHPKYDYQHPVQQYYNVFKHSKELYRLVDNENVKSCSTKHK